MTTPQQLEQSVGPALSGAGYVVESSQLPGGPVLLGRRKDFRVRWMLTQLKTTVAVATVPHATPTLVEQFAREAFDIAKAFKGGLPNGLQSGCGCVAVLVAGSVDPAAAELARSKPDRAWFKGISALAVLDASTGQVHAYDGKVVVGRVYVPFLRSQLALVTDAVRSALR